MDSQRTPLIWLPGCRKETMALLETLWSTGDDAIRSLLTKVLVEGPPDHLGKNTEDPERSRARRIFDRIAYLRRKADILPAALEAAYQSILADYPGWQLPEGEQAQFSRYTRILSGSDVSLEAAEPATTLDAESLLATLQEKPDSRTDLLEDWRDRVLQIPEDAIALLRGLVPTAVIEDVDVWRTTLIGLRESVRQEAPFTDLLSILAIAPDHYYADATFSDAVADILDAASNTDAFDLPDLFWRVFDLTLAAVVLDPANSDSPDDGRWLSLAINRSLGRLATAFFNAIYKSRLKSGQGFSTVQEARLNRLITPEDRRYRISRIIAASRLPYLFAVAPAWTRTILLPCFDWSDEEETIACWQGFAWHPRIGTDLWIEIRDSYFAIFARDRLAALTDSHTILAEILMLAGIEFPSTDVPAEKAKQAIRAMTVNMRLDALWWVWQFMYEGAQSTDANAPERVDAFWQERVQPWLKRVWPHENQFKSPQVSERFALSASATYSQFPTAVAFVTPYLVPGDGGHLIMELVKTEHPDIYPVATLKLLELAVDLRTTWLLTEFRSVLARVAAAAPELAETPVYRNFNWVLQQRLN